MRILFMADLQPDPNSGAAGTEVQTIAALRNLGHEVDEIWGPDIPRRVSHGNLHYLLELPFRYRSEMLSRLSRRSYDVVHVNQPHGYLAARELRKMHLPAVFVHRSHGYERRVEAVMSSFEEGRSLRAAMDPRTVARWLMQRLLRFNTAGIVRYADGHIVSCTQCRDYLVNVEKVPSEHVSVIAQASPASFLKASVPPLTEDRLRRLLYVGQFAPFKGPHILAAAISDLFRKGEVFEMTWVCAKEHHQSVRSLLSADLNDRVSLEDWRSQEGLLSLLDSHGTFLFPSLFEGFGKGFLEAMSRGLVCVASNNGGMRDVIQDGVSGFLVPTGDPTALSAKIVSLFDNPSLASYVSKEARKRALEYSWSRTGAETAAFYSNLLRMRSETRDW